MLISTPLLVANGEAYKLTAVFHEGDYQVRIEDDRSATLLTITGPAHDLHGLFLGLHNVLVDAGRDGGRSELVIPGHTDEGDERGGSAGE